MIAGHEGVRAELERALPPVTLLLGPPSVGKATLAVHLARWHRGMLSERWRLSAQAAREIAEDSPVRHARLHVYVIELDNSAEAAQNILLKVLEEPPPHCRFILVASKPPLPTVMSRSRVYRLGLLTDAQVAQVLVSNGLASAYEAAMAAARGRGQVEEAMASIADKESQRVTAVVVAALRAAVAGGGPALELALRNWTPEHTAVLRQWSGEAATGRWAIFEHDIAPVPRARALRVLEVLSQHSVTQPDGEVVHARTAPAVALAQLKEKR